MAQRAGQRKDHCQLHAGSLGQWWPQLAADKENADLSWLRPPAPLQLRFPGRAADAEAPQAAADMRLIASARLELAALAITAVGERYPLATSLKRRNVSIWSSKFGMRYMG